MAVSAVWRLACLLAPIPIGTKEHTKAHRRCQRIGGSRGASLWATILAYPFRYALSGSRSILRFDSV